MKSENLMMNREQILNLLSELARRRPIFHSEADFQHALAWLIHEKHPKWSVRLEYPFPGVGEIDILLKNSEDHFLIELKYKTTKRSLDIDGENFLLKKHGAQPLNRYDGIKDVERIQRSNLSGATIFLTDDSEYWMNHGDNGRQFSIAEGREIPANATLAWNDPTRPLAKKRPHPICLKSNCQLNWVDYEEGKRGFKYLLLMIGV